jgi:hypothetical protein
MRYGRGTINNTLTKGWMLRGSWSGGRDGEGSRFVLLVLLFAEEMHSALKRDKL